MIEHATIGYTFTFRRVAMTISFCLLALLPVASSAGMQSCGARPSTGDATDYIGKYFDVNELSDNEYEYVESELIRLARSPLNLNTASLESMLAVPGITESDVKAIKDFRHQNTTLEILADLEKIENLSIAAIQILRIVGCLTEARVVSASAKNRSFSIRIRSDRRWDSGEIEPDGSTIGSPVRSYARLRFSNERTSASVTLQKDRFERFTWNPQQGWYGYDHIAGHVTWHSEAKTLSVVAGDYTVALGQGIVLSRPFGTRISSDAPWRVLRSVSGARGYAGSYEAFALRGVAARFVPTPGLSADVFFSRRRFDVRPVADAVAITNLPGTGDVIDGTTVYKLSSTGIHISSDQIRYRKLVESQTAGAAVIGTISGLKVGMLLIHSRFSEHLILPGAQDGRISSLDGSLFSSISLGGLSATGEVSLNKLSEIALVAGATYRFSRRLILTAVYRQYPSGEGRFRGQPFGHKVSFGSQNGLYLSWTVRQQSEWSLSTSIDLSAGSGSNSYGSLPARYQDVRMTFMLSPGGPFKLTSQLKFRSENKIEKRPDFTGSVLNTSNEIHFRQISLQIIYTGGRFSLRTRFDANSIDTSRQSGSYGFHAYYAASGRINNGLEIVFQQALFDAGSFSNRFYIYEKDVDGKLSAPVLSGSGSRSTVTISWQTTQSSKLQLKYAQMTGYPLSEKTEGAELYSAPRLRRSVTLQLAVDV